MQKRKEKQNAKPVGAGLVPAQNKGITLIALIITIIVMLILVGVTINVALNGGLFTKADYATKQTQIAAEKEELLSAVVAALNNDLEIPNAAAIKLEAWQIAGADGGPYTCTSPNGNMFTVDKNGKIQNVAGDNTVVTKSGYYIHERTTDTDGYTQVWHIKFKEENMISIMYYAVEDNAIIQNINFGDFTISEENTEIVNLINYYDNTTITIQPSYYVFEAGGADYIKGNKLYVINDMDNMDYIEATLDENFVLP